jgi:predicted transcriptional regulator YheO
LAWLNPSLVDILRRTADAIVTLVGPHCEVVIYDFEDLEHAVVAVAGNVTGRRPGAPVPDLIFFAEALNRDTTDKLNYRTWLGERQLQSALVWIKGQDGSSIGAIGINIDATDLLQARDLLDRLAASTLTVAEVGISDTFAKDMDDLIHLSVAEFLRQESISTIEALNQDEKLRLIQTLEERGLFKIRGAVNQVADMLNVSRATIYNYRSTIKV